MNTSSCAVVREAAPEFVLGTLDGAERARVIDHLDGCARCRDEVAALADTVNDLALLAPEVAPSPGFAERVLALGSATSATATVADVADAPRPPLVLVEPLPASRPQRRRRAWALVLAAAAVVALAVGMVARRDVAGTGTVTFAVMVAPDGGVMGTTSAVGDDGAVAVAVDYPSNWHDYRLEVVRLDGSTMTLGPMTLRDGAWRWQGDVPDTASVDRLRVVRPDGRVTCWGRLPV